MTTILNYTGNAVRVMIGDGEWFILKPEQDVPHVHIKRDLIETVNGISLMQQRIIRIKDLPKQREGFVYIVSKIVAMNSLDRDDLYVVDDLIKQSTTREILGAKCISKLKKPIP